MKKFIQISTLAIMFAITTSTFASKATLTTTGSMNTTSNWNTSPYAVDTVLIPASMIGYWTNTFDLRGRIVFVWVKGTISPSTGPASGGHEFLLDSGSQVLLDTGGTLTNISGNSSNHALIIDGVCVWGKRCCGSNSTINGVAIVNLNTQCGFILPVHLLSFTGEKANEVSVNLKWATASEQNSDHFDVMFSSDGKTFTKVGTVTSKAINGNSASISNYEFTHVINSEMRINTGEHMFFYQLVQVDLNGSIEPLKTIVVKNNQSDALPLTVAQSADKVYIQIGKDYEEGYDINIYNIFGQKIFTTTGTKTGWIEISNDDLSHGMLIVQANLHSEFTDGFSEKRKILVQ